MAANRGLIIDFNGESSEQIKGLAMGIACSPDLANLYGAHFEEEFMSTPGLTEKVPFYGRYLDDLLAFVVADTAAEAKATMQGLVFDECEIGWEVSEWHTAFLDLLVYLDPADGSIQHKPYKKPMNHRERIPWASSHPKDVKKGTFTGEMSRLAVLSSKPEHYLEALADLQALYIARGYPTNLVRKWTRDNSSKRWLNRHTKSEPSGDVFVLKSKYNPAWTAFNIHELQQTVVSSWRSSLLEYEGRMMKHDYRSRAKLDPAPRVSPPTPATQLNEPRSRVDTVQRTLDDLWRRRDGTPDEDMASALGRAPSGSISPQSELMSVDVPLTAGIDDEPQGSLSPVSRRSDAMDVDDDEAAVSSEGRPTPVPRPAELVRADPGWTYTGNLLRVGNSNAREFERVVDANYLGYTDRRWLVSRKRNDTLSDHVNRWRKHMLRVEVISAEELEFFDRTMDEWQ